LFESQLPRGSTTASAIFIVHYKRRPIFYTEMACLQENGQLIAVTVKCRDDASGSREWISGVRVSSASGQLLSTRLLRLDKNETA